MDFSVSGSDSWDTTAAQENFIQNYFQEQKLPISSKSLKRKRKRMRYGNLTDDQYHQKQLMELPIEKSLQHTEIDSMTKLLVKPMKKKLKRQIKEIPESTEGSTISKSHDGSTTSHDFLCTENKASKKLKNKNKNSLIHIKSKQKMDQPETDVRSVSQQEEFIPLMPNPIPKNSQKKKMKKTSELNKDLDSEQEEVTPLEPNPVSKNSIKKKMKKTSGLNEDFDLEQEEFIPLKSNPVPKNSKKKKMKKTLGLNKDLDLEQDEFIPLEPNPVPKNSKKKKMKKVSELNEDLDSEHDECLPFEPNSTLKHPKKKKTLELRHNLGLKQSEYLPLKSNSEPKKLKKKKVKKTFDEDLDLEQFSGDSCDESDEELVSEIKNSEIFKEIEQLMKQSPFQSNPKGSGKSVNKQSTEDSDESIGELSDENSEKSFGELSSEDSDNSSSEVALVSKVVQVAKNVKESSKLPEKQITSSKIGTYNTNDQDSVPDKASNAYGLKLQNDAKSLVRNVNSKKETVASALKSKAQQKLQAAKFRFLNEKLYTETGGNAFQYFQENVDEFHDYHLGYSLQVSKWPMNPVSKIISDLQNLKKNIVIADMGCGDAKIAQTLTNSTVHSFDIVALNEFVKACDISKVPLQKESVDVVVFCLSLMGTNLKDYLMEAHRILKMGGTLKIAEVESRIDVNTFVKNLKPMGFSLQKQDLKHKVFVFLDFKKEKNKFKKANIPSISLRPCLYKKR